MAWTTPRTYTAGEVLTAAILNVDWRDNLTYLYGPPRCRVYHTSSQNVSDNTLTAMFFGAEDYDTDAMHSTSSFQTVVTFNTAGVYRIIGQVVWAINGTGIRRSDLFVNASATVARYEPGGINGRDNMNLIVWADSSRAATDFVQLAVTQTSGITLAVLGEDSAYRSTPVLCAHWIGG